MINKDFVKQYIENKINNKLGNGGRSSIDQRFVKKMLIELRHKIKLAKKAHVCDADIDELLATEDSVSLLNVLARNYVGSHDGCKLIKVGTNYSYSSVASSGMSPDINMLVTMPPELAFCANLVFLVSLCSENVCENYSDKDVTRVDIKRIRNGLTIVAPKCFKIAQEVFNSMYTQTERKELINSRLFVSEYKLGDSCVSLYKMRQDADVYSSSAGCAVHLYDITIFDALFDVPVNIIKYTLDKYGKMPTELFIEELRSYTDSINKEFYTYFVSNDVDLSDFNYVLRLIENKIGLNMYLATVSSNLINNVCGVYLSTVWNNGTHTARNVVYAREIKDGKTGVSSIVPEFTWSYEPDYVKAGHKFVHRAGFTIADICLDLDVDMLYTCNYKRYVDDVVGTVIKLITGHKYNGDFDEFYLEEADANNIKIEGLPGNADAFIRRSLELRRAHAIDSGLFDVNIRNNDNDARASSPLQPEAPDITGRGVTFTTTTEDDGVHVVEDTAVNDTTTNLRIQTGIRLLWENGRLVTVPVYSD